MSLRLFRIWIGSFNRPQIIRRQQGTVKFSQSALILRILAARPDISVFSGVARAVQVALDLPDTQQKHHRLTSQRVRRAHIVRFGHRLLPWLTSVPAPIRL